MTGLESGQVRLGVYTYNNSFSRMHFRKPLGRRCCCTSSSSTYLPTYSTAKATVLLLVFYYYNKYIL